MNKNARAYYDRKLSKLPDFQDRKFKRTVPNDVKDIKRVHFSGICGTAMGSLAVLLKLSSYRVSGSDVHCYPPMSDLIDTLGIDFKEGFFASHLKGADAVIIGNVCDPSNEEAKAAREKDIPTMSIGEAIELFLIKNKKSIVVAGTHGKTTTTGLLSHVLSSAGFKPGYFIGGVPQGEMRNAQSGEGEYFVIEGDEYDTAYFDKAPKFLHYDPSIAIVTSLEFDHADIYHDFEEYKQAFRFLVKEVPEEGALFLQGDDENVRLLGAEAQTDVYYYGLGPRNDITAKGIEISDKGQKFELIFKDESMGWLEIPLFGKHNLLNALAVCGVSIRIGMSIKKLQEGLKSFNGMKRRQEVIFDKDITIIDDFAHHPTAVMETIAAIRSKFPQRRIVAFFEPRSVTSRKKIFEDDYGKAFDEADLTCLSTPELKSVDDISDFIDPSKIVSTINERGGEAYSFRSADELLVAAKEKISKGDVVLIMSNGSFDGIHRKLAESFGV